MYCSTEAWPLDSTNRSRSNQSGSARVEGQEPRPEHVGGRAEGHRRARVAVAGLLDGVHGQGPDGVDGQPVQVGTFGCLHGYTSTSWPSSDQRVWKVPGRSVRR